MEFNIEFGNCDKMYNSVVEYIIYNIIVFSISTYLVSSHFHSLCVWTIVFGLVAVTIITVIVKGTLVSWELKPVSIAVSVSRFDRVGGRSGLWKSAHTQQFQRSLLFLEWLLKLENQSHAVIATYWARATARAVQLRQYKQYKNIFKSIVLSLVSCEIKLLLYFYNC